MVQIAVADGTMMTPLSLYRIGVKAATGAPNVRSSAVNARHAGDRTSVARQVQRTGPAESGREHLAEGFAWVLDACD